MEFIKDYWLLIILFIATILVLKGYWWLCRNMFTPTEDELSEKIIKRNNLERNIDVKIK